jgi:hypothetical protein
MAVLHLQVFVTPFGCRAYLPVATPRAAFKFKFSKSDHHRPGTHDVARLAAAASQGCGGRRQSPPTVDSRGSG